MYCYSFTLANETYKHIPSSMLNALYVGGVIAQRPVAVRCSPFAFERLAIGVLISGEYINDNHRAIVAAPGGSDAGEAVEVFQHWAASSVAGSRNQPQSAVARRSSAHVASRPPLLVLLLCLRAES